MRKADENKKMLSLREKPLIEAMASDEAIAVKRSQSSVIELHILDSMMPQNRDAESFVRLLYDGSTPPDIERTFAAIFGYLAAGVRGQAQADNAKTLVSLYHTLSVNANSPTGKEETWPYIKGELEALAEKLEHDAKDTPAEKDALKNQADGVREYTKIIEDNPANLRFISLSGLVLSSWENLKNYTRTYRLLAAVASSQHGIRNDEDARFSLVDELKKVSAEWTS